jgi:uncharacterized protein HemX
MSLKKKQHHDLGHDLTVLAFMFILGYAGWWIWDQDKKLDLKEETILQKQIETNRAWEEVQKAYERKEHLEQEASKAEEKIIKAEKKFEDIKKQYQRIDRIQKDLDRIVGK